MAKLELTQLTKRYEGSAAVDGIDLTVAHGEFVCLLGPSGCGKTTTLRMIAGFLEPDEGRISVGGHAVSSPGNVVPPERRSMSMLFQSYAIWPHMTVRDNVAYGLRMQRVPEPERRQRTDALLQATRLSTQADKYPGELSGGQQQRVALARALAPKPDILLLDEPLSNLDANLRGEMRFEIRRLHDQFQYTSIYVTHDQTEAMTMADRIVVMNAGRIEQIGTPAEVYQKPRSEFVARFIGASNVLKAMRVGDREVEIAGHKLVVQEGEFNGPGDPMSICIKMHDLEILPWGAPQPGDNVLPGVVRKHAYLGSHRDYIVDVGQEVLITAPAELDIAPGSKVGVRFPPQHCRGLTH
ncbi:MAG TPA: ABC transporter ATP-binding protein [Casimicrobiaceae bacterium]|nr:ABC transporter ATP-binding protein [Casimicrobiaceae bacterium]